MAIDGEDKSKGVFFQAGKYIGKGLSLYVEKYKGG